MEPALRSLKAVLCGLCCCLLAINLHAGGPLIVAGTVFDGTLDGRSMVWDANKAITYRTPSAGGLGTLSNPQAIDRVRQLFQVWEDVETANIRFQNAGPIQATGAFQSGMIDTVAKFEAVFNSCLMAQQSPIIFASPTLLRQLNIDVRTIGFAGPCTIDSSGHMLSAFATLNGGWIDGIESNGELTPNQFDEAIAHEFGHFSGLDHSQLSIAVLGQSPDRCTLDLLTSLPLMFPFAFCQARRDAGLPILAADDMAWISFLYPEMVNDPQNKHVPFNSVYGTISGTAVFNADDNIPVQGINIIAQSSSNQKQVSVVSGYRFTGNFGQSVGGTNGGDGGIGSHDPLLIGSFDIPVPAGNYTLSTESIHPAFVRGSSVGPLSPPIPAPGGALQEQISVAAGSQATGIKLDLKSPLPTFDHFEPQ